MAKSKPKGAPARAKTSDAKARVPIKQIFPQRSRLQQMSDAKAIFDPEGASVARKVAGDAAKRMGRTTDGFDNFISRVGLQTDNQQAAGTYRLNLVTRNRLLLESAYRGSGIVGSIVDMIPEDMTRAGVTVTTNESKQDIKDLTTQISRLQLWPSTASGLKWGRLYGGAIGVLQIEGQDLATPLRIETVGRGQFKGLVAYDRWQVNPDLQQVIRTGPNLGLPEFYSIVNDPRSTAANFATPTGQLTVHHSRCVRFLGNELPYFQAITEMMWGESVLERLWDRLISFDNATLSAGQLVDRANLRTVGIDGLREILAAGGEAQKGLESMFDMMRFMQSNEGITLLDKEDEFASTSYSFAGLPETLLQLLQQISGASGIPLIRLLGQGASGLNASSDGEIRMYYDSIHARQEAQLRNPWDLILKVLWRSTYDESAPQDLQFTFTPLWQMSTKDKADIAKVNMETVATGMDIGVLSRADGMTEVRQASTELGFGTSITDEEIAEAEKEPVVPQPDADPEDPTSEESLKSEKAEEDKPAEKKKKKTGDRKWWAPWRHGVAKRL